MVFSWSLADISYIQQGWGTTGMNLDLWLKSGFFSVYEMRCCLFCVDALTKVFQKQNFSSLTVNTFGE